MTLWWHSNQARLSAEKAGLAALEASQLWLENLDWKLDDQFRLVVFFDLILAHDRFALKLIYHNTFPSSPPSVRPVDSTRLSDHQYLASGDLCLQIRPDNWRPEFTGAQMVESAYNLFCEEAPDVDGNTHTAPSEHALDPTIRYRNTVLRFYVTPVTAFMLAVGAGKISEVSVNLNWCADEFAIATIASCMVGEEVLDIPDIPKALKADTYQKRFKLLKIEMPVSKVPAETKTDLVDALGEAAALADDIDGWLLLDTEGALTLIRALSDDDALLHYRTIYQPVGENRTGDIRANLAKKRVGLVGLGSLGSKIAVSLARAGVSSFILVDGDVLHGGNLERHDGDWRDVGLHKVDMVARRLKLILPNVEVSTRRTAIGAQVSSDEAGNVDSALGNCDLIIDASADPDAFTHLAGLALLSDKALLWGSVYAGGLGGEIARSRPHLDPSPYDVRDAITAFERAQTEDPPERIGESYGADGPVGPWIASDADVSTVAAHMSALALDTISKREPSRFDAPAYLIGHDRFWFFKAPFHVQPVIANAPLRKPVSTAEEDQVEKDFVDDLIKAKTDEFASRKNDS